MTPGVSSDKSMPSIPLPLISVNGETIDEDLFAAELRYHPHKEFSMVLQQAGQALVIRQLLLEQASQLGLDISADAEEMSIQKLLEDVVDYDDPDEDDCRRYFDNNPQKFMAMPLMEIEHILLVAPKNDVSARAAALSAAKDIIAQLQKDPLLFPALAEQYSACPSKKESGALGSISKGQTVAEFERQLMFLPQGLSDKAIETRYGFHVVNIAHKVDGKPLEYSMVATKVRDYLAHRSSRLAIQAYIQSLVEESDIEGIEIEFSDDNIHIS